MIPVFVEWPLKLIIQQLSSEAHEDYFKADDHCPGVHDQHSIDEHSDLLAEGALHHHYVGLDLEFVDHHLYELHSVVRVESSQGQNDEERNDS